MRILVAACIAALLVGCVATRQYPAPEVSDSVQLVEVRRQAAEDPSGIQQVVHRPKNVLVLSGGGMFGAFTSGVLRGWTTSGNRPTFDVVTGISTGALIAPYALLGSEYDDALERSYTTLRDNDIFKRRLLVTLPWADSIADSSPLRHRIESEVTQQLLERIAKVHREGRRLYIGTTDIDAKKLVVWDMGAIANSDDPFKLDIFRKVILASASVPGFLPPVRIDVQIDGKLYTELHVDGGVTANLFLRPDMVGPKPVPGQVRDTDSHVWVIVAGKLRPEREEVSQNLLRIGSESLEGLMQSAFENDLIRIYMLSRSRGAKFGLAAIPQDFDGELDSLKFNPKTMSDLYHEGARFGASGDRWMAQPPGLSPCEQRTRGGVRFVTQQKERK